MILTLNQSPLSMYNVFALRELYYCRNCTMWGPLLVWKIRNDVNKFFEPTVHVIGKSHSWFPSFIVNWLHGLRTPGEEIAFTARPKLNSQSQIFRYGRSIFCLPHWPKFSDFFDSCLHWVSVVRDWVNVTYHHQQENPIFMPYWVRCRAWRAFFKSNDIHNRGATENKAR